MHIAIQKNTTLFVPNMNVDCCICLQNIGSKNPACKTTSCGHTFHVDCLLEWRKRSSSCPICRQSSKNDEISKHIIEYLASPQNVELDGSRRYIRIGVPPWRRYL